MTGSELAQSAPPRQPRRKVELDRPDMPQLGARDSELSQFNRGDALFEAVFRAADGLGPVYIRPSCAACHQDDGRGPGLVTRLAPEVPTETQDTATSASSDVRPFAHGDVVRPYVSGPGTSPVVARGPVVQRHRLPPAVFGRGHMEAVAEEEIERLAEQARQRNSTIKGRIHRVTYASAPNPDRRFHQYEPGQGQLIGRFGLKARIATLDDFTADALQGDMGLTSALRRQEVPNPDGLTDDDKAGVDVDADAVNALADYVRLLEIPERKGQSDEGAALFEQIQCATCHVPTLRTRADYPIAQLAGTSVAVYTDFLLHDMGVSLADGVVEGDATGREWRTAPLIGLRFSPALMHDARAKTVEEAILAHGGEGSEAQIAVDQFKALDASAAQILIHYVEGL